MRVESAQLPGPAASEDRIFVTSNAVIMLDGASPFLPTPVATSTYVDHLGGHLRDLLNEDPERDLDAALAESIAQTSTELVLQPGHSPSSTVAMVRVRSDGSIDALVLGDTQIASPGGIMRDERIAQVGASLRDAYRARLSAGFGYDDDHGALLRQLQREQAGHRNRRDGYWIAEIDPAAAQHAFTANWSSSSAPWIVLATDGAYRSLWQLGLDDWGTIASRSAMDIHRLLADCHTWEAETDPSGKLQPRAKRHDDKAIAAIQMSAAIR